jgi:hypothetical protein
MFLVLVVVLVVLLLVVLVLLLLTCIGNRTWKVFFTFPQERDS